MSHLLQIRPDDNVAVALETLPADAVALGLALREAIPCGHKVALTDIAEGDAVIKYGYPIGQATQDIARGAHVHSHNLVSALGDNVPYAFTPRAAPRLPAAPFEAPTFHGFRRPDGRAGIRNEIWIINTVGCVNVTSERIARRAERELAGTSVGGVHAFTHPFGCSQLGDDLRNTQKILAGLARHPNAGGVLILGLGCENNQLRSFLNELGDYDPNRVRFFNAQDVEDEVEEGVQAIRELADYAGRFSREPIPVSELILGMKCGGSDGFSGITANPLVGRIADMQSAFGATTLLTEVPEMFGAEQVLMGRARDESVFRATAGLVNDFKDYFRSHGEGVAENPSPGNIEGGITTLEEKSLGCIQKGGRAPVVAALAYGAAAAPGRAGIALVNAPGNDAVSCTALAAAGAHLILFTTGRGTPLGAPVPTLKIATNSELAARKAGWIDFNAGTLLDGAASLDAMTDQLYRQLLDVAGGAAETCNEANGYREIALWKSGVTL